MGGMIVVTVEVMEISAAALSCVSTSSNAF